MESSLLDVDLLGGWQAPATSEDRLWTRLEQGLALAAGMGDDELDERPLVIDRLPDISLADYMREAWPIIDQRNPLEWNWHLDQMCALLTEVSMGQRTELIINVPPGMTKSMTVCVMWPTWEWTWLPQSRWLFYSFNEDFALRDAVRSRRLMRSRWYQRRWGHVFKFVGDQNQKGRYENDATGFRVASGMAGSVTGERGDRIVIDDPIKATEARNDTALTTVNSTYDEAISTRLNQPMTSAKVAIMQRVAGNDLSGHLLKTGDFSRLSLPMEYEPPPPPEKMETIPVELRSWSTPDIMAAYPDPRTKPGELLHPARFPRSVVDKMKRILGSFATAAQFQQRPVPAGGGVFKMEWFGFWEPADESYGPVHLLTLDGKVLTRLPRKAPATYQEMLQSHDLTFTGTTAYAVGDVYGRTGMWIYLLDEERTDGEFPVQVAQIRSLTKKWPMAALKLVEAKANGQAAISTLRTTIPGLVPVPVTEGSKPERYDSISAFVEAGHCLVPHPDMPGFGWVRDWLVEVCTAPYGAYSDRADVFYMAVARYMLKVKQEKDERSRQGTRSTSGMGM
jgi:hypothetical protein